MNHKLLQNNPTNQNKGIAIYLETYGCQMNEYDSRLVRSLLEAPQSTIPELPGKHHEPDGSLSYFFTPHLAEADWILMNTCSVRENAEERIYSRLRHIRQHRKKNAVVGILGCMAQNLKEKLLAKDLPSPPIIRLIAGPDSYRKLPFLLKNAFWDDDLDENSQKTVIETTRDREEIYEGIMPYVDGSPSAFVTIMRGCNNFCSFCVVPYTRGRERSLEPGKILSQIQQLVASGVREVMLLGQNVNSYHYQSESESMDFTSLIEFLARESGLDRIRFTSPHPKDFPLALLEVIRRYDNLCPQIHLPLQSGSDRILKLMKRDYTSADYLNLVRTIRSVIGEVSLSTDIIFGFPGETDEEANETLKVMEEATFHNGFIFKYSPREHTYASGHLKDDVPEEVKVDRIKIAVERQHRISLYLNQKMVGKRVQVLVEGISRRSNQDLIGRDIWGQKVIFPGEANAIGSLCEVDIIGATSITMLGNQTQG